MSLVNVINIAVLDNPTFFLNSFVFEITFECLEALDQDLEWKVVYVGDAESTSGDQILEEVMVGPVPVGIHKFVLQADAPNAEKLPSVLGITVVLVTCTYKDQEFCRIGYYVNNELSSQETPTTMDAANEMQQDNEDDDSLQQQEELQNVDLSRVIRTTLADKPRVTRFPIQWHDKATTADDGLALYTPVKHDSALKMDAMVVSPPSGGDAMQL